LGQIVAAYAYEDGARVREIDLRESRRYARSKNEFVWIGMLDPTEAELRNLQQQFDLHSLAVEDALLDHHAPKLALYGRSLFIVLRTAETTGRHVRFGHTYIFVGPDYIITVRRGPSTSYVPVRSRCEADPDLLRLGVDYVLYELLSFVIDNYLGVIGKLQEAADAIDTRIEAGRHERMDIRRLYALRRELVKMRRITAPMVEICARLKVLEVPGLDADVRPYLTDLHAHAVSVNEAVDALREVLDFGFEAIHLQESSRQGDVSRRFAGWAAILAVPTAIAGIYGMNFEHMPELSWRYGYPAVLVLIFAVSVGLYLRFKRSGWL
jgi:magnesium transporter